MDAFSIALPADGPLSSARSLLAERLRGIKRRLPFVMGSAFSVALLSGGLPRLQAVTASLQPPPASLTARAAAGGAAPPAEPAVEVQLTPSTRSYRADGYFTGVQSSVVLPQPAGVVFDSLASDMQVIFGPIQDCADERVEGSPRTRERLHRVVTIPFTLSYFSSQIRLKMEVQNDRAQGQIDLRALSRGRFLSGFDARFTVTPVLGPDGEENTAVRLDSRVDVKTLPPPPLKGLVKGVIIRKMDRCMRDLAAFHSERPRPGSAHAQPRLLRALAGNIQPSRALRRLLSTERRLERNSLL